MPKAYNPTDLPVIIDAEGHTLGGGEWGQVDEGEERVTGAVVDVLLVVPEPPETPTDDTGTAQAETTTTARRRSKET